MIADKIIELSQGIGPENTREHLIPYYCQFLEDNESEVRTAALRRLTEFSKMIEPQTLINTVVPSLVKL